MWMCTPNVSRCRHGGRTGTPACGHTGPVSPVSRGCAKAWLGSSAGGLGCSPYPSWPDQSWSQTQHRISKCRPRERAAQWHAPSTQQAAAAPALLPSTTGRPLASSSRGPRDGSLIHPYDVSAAVIGGVHDKTVAGTAGTAQTCARGGALGWRQVAALAGIAMAAALSFSRGLGDINESYIRFKKY